MKTQAPTIAFLEGDTFGIIPEEDTAVGHQHALVNEAGHII